jgi:UDP-N-acetylmuramoyl-tripeptide--D-alanyl-D-alanine ligase
MLASIVSQSRQLAYTEGNLNNQIGLPLSLLAMKPDTEVGVFELGMNHPGEISGLCEILHPDCGVITAIGPAHIEFFDSVDAIAREKGALLAALPQGGRAVLWRDDERFEILRGMCEGEVSTVSLRGDADYVVSYDAGSAELMIQERGSTESLSFEWKHPGEHNALNAGLAVAAARGLGLEWNAVEAGLASYRPLKMRWTVEDIRGIRVINDAYNANPLSMRAALKTFADEKSNGAKWLVLGGMLELGKNSKQEHVELGRFAAGCDWQGIIVVGDSGDGIVEGLLDGGFSDERIQRSSDGNTAAAILNDNLTEGDSVLLKASRGAALERVVVELKSMEE